MMLDALMYSAWIEYVLVATTSKACNCRPSSLLSTRSVW